MNRIAAGLPTPLVAGHMAVALLAAVGTLFLLPSPVPLDPWVAVPVLTALFAVGLFASGRVAADRARREAERLAASDPDTGLATRAAADRLLALEFAAAQRGRALTVVLFRIEQMPVYAGKHGQVAARHLLRLAGRTLRRNARRMHLAAHYGRGQGVYLSILSGMDPDGATIYARRVRQELRMLKGIPPVPPVSVGVVPFDLSMSSPEDLLQQAERAVTRAGEAGGRIVVMGQVTSEAVD